MASGRIAPGGNAEYHGTAVAGVIAAENDGVGTVGVAFGTSITGVEILGLTSDAAIVQSMAQQHNFDVVNHSWGFVVPFADSQLSSNAAWSSFFASFPDAVQTGRGGLGTVIVHSAGNDRTNQFNSGLARDTNDFNFTNSRFLVAVAAIDNNGSASNYSTPGAALLVAAPSSSDASHDGIGPRTALPRPAPTRVWTPSQPITRSRTIKGRSAALPRHRPRSPGSLP